MKFLSIVVLFAIYAFSMASENSKKSETIPSRDSIQKLTGEVNIIELIDAADPEDNLAQLKPYDVIVYKLISRDSSVFFGNKYVKGFYSLKYFQEEEGKLRGHKAWVEIDEQYDKASYKWLSYHSVTIRLFNSTSGKEKSYKLFGQGESSGMELE